MTKNNKKNKEKVYNVIIVCSNPLQKWQRSYNSRLKIILKQYPDLEKQFRSYMPRLPSMYGLLKIHKVNNPMQPIISTIDPVNYKLAHWISDHLSPLLNKIAGTHLTNTLDFVNTIRDLGIQDKTMVSFDVDQ